MHLLLRLSNLGNKVLVSLLEAVLTTDTGSLDACTTSSSLVFKGLLTGSLSLTLVNVLHEDTFVLEDITLRLHVKFVVKVGVNLGGFPVLLQETAENTLAAHPKDLDRHTGVGATFALTMTAVSTLSTLFLVLQGTSTGVDNLWLLDDETILNESLNLTAAVGVGDLADLVGVKPDFALTNLEHTSGKALLKTKHHHLD
jgi:hypothetical protein